MTLRARKWRAETTDGNSEKGNTPYDTLRLMAAAKLNTFHHHYAGGGSEYLTIGASLEIRLSDHENLAHGRTQPTLNIVRRELNMDDVRYLGGRITYPRLCKKTAFAKHVALTVPKLKKILPPDCYENVRENEAYPNTFAQYVVVDKALSACEAAGITDRIPVRQESRSVEDYDGQ